jgi:hypothetical protein
MNAAETKINFGEPGHDAQQAAWWAHNSKLCQRAELRDRIERSKCEFCGDRAEVIDADIPLCVPCCCRGYVEGAPELVAFVGGLMAQYFEQRRAS